MHIINYTKTKINVFIVYKKNIYVLLKIKILGHLQKNMY